MISYENVAAAIDWLSAAFGFRERGDRYAEPDGTVTHAELELDAALVMLGWPGPGYRGRRDTLRFASTRANGSPSPT
jgi:PhnB protein